MSEIETGYEGWRVGSDGVARRLHGGGFHNRVEECDPLDLVAEILLQRARVALTRCGFGGGRDQAGLVWWMHPQSWDTILVARYRFASISPIIVQLELFGIQVDDSHTELTPPDVSVWPVAAELLLVCRA